MPVLSTECALRIIRDVSAGKKFYDLKNPEKFFGVLAYQNNKIIFFGESRDGFALREIGKLKLGIWLLY